MTVVKEALGLLQWDAETARRFCLGDLVRRIPW
jgi:hypothetical protein